MTVTLVNGAGRVGLWLSGAVLVGAVALQVARPFEGRFAARPPHLSAVVPAELAGWVARELPLGATESLQARSAQLLGYDEYVHREYRRGSQFFTVYIAYWRPGGIDPTSVTNHTPDVCWTANGWRCRRVESAMSASVRGRALWPAEARQFAAPAGGGEWQVMFWHLIGGEPNPAPAGFHERPVVAAGWRHVFARLTLQSREQYFVRVVSNVPFERLWREAGFNDAMDRLGRWQLYAGGGRD